MAEDEQANDQRSMNDIVKGAGPPAKRSADDERLHSLANLAETIEVAMSILGFLAVAGGIILVIIGQVTVEGEYGEIDVTYDLRSPGIMLAGFGLLFAPLAVLVARLAKTWALHTATE